MSRFGLPVWLACLCHAPLVQALVMLPSSTLPQHQHQCMRLRMTEDAAVDLFVDEVERALSPNRDTFISLQLSNRRVKRFKDEVDNKLKDDDTDVFKDLRSVAGRLVSLKAGKRLQLNMRYTTNDQVKNFELGDASRVEVTRLLHEAGFKKALLSTTENDFELSQPKGEPTAGARLVKKEPKTKQKPDAESLMHDRKKNVPVETDAPFLRALKVTGEGGRPVAGMADKLRQIERFVEIVDGLVEKSGLTSTTPLLEEADAKPPLQVVDMGSGLAYLTFAIHAHLGKRFDLTTIGIEERKALVEQTTTIARKLGSDFDGLSFKQGTIESTMTSNKQGEKGLRPNVLVALHACDTATDDAIYSGIESGAEIIVTSPCCHKEVRRMMERGFGGGEGVLTSPGAPLHDLLRHGIFREREAEMVTDALRALLLELAGYEVTVLEFVDSIHTPKNVMLAAVKRQGWSSGYRSSIAMSKFGAREEELRGRISTLMGSFGLKTQKLAALMGLVDKDKEQGNEGETTGLPKLKLARKRARDAN